MTTEPQVEGLRAALYLRVSSEQQAQQGTSIPSQRSELQAYAARRGWRVVAEYVDEAESAKTDERPDFQRLISDSLAKVRPFDVVLVYALDRFARNRYDSGWYKRMLRKAGIAVASYSQQLDQTPEGQLLEGVIEGVDQYYSDRLAIVTLRGQKEIARRGFRAGGQAPFGYRHAKRVEGGAERTVLEPDPALAPVLVEIFELRARGVNRSTIASMLDARYVPPPRRNHWSDGTIDAIVRNDVYLGRLTFNRRRWKDRRPTMNPESEWIVVDGAHPALVTEQLFADANASRRTRKQAARHVYLLTGILTCAACGSPAIAQKSASRHGEHGTLYYYACHAARKEKTCAAPSLRAEIVERSVIAALRKPLSDAALEHLWARIRDTKIDPQLGLERKAIAELERRHGNVARAIEDGATSLATRLLELEEEIALARRRLANLEAQPDGTRPQTPEELKRRMEVLSEMIGGPDRSSVREALHASLVEVRCDFGAGTLQLVVRLPSSEIKRGTASKVVPLSYCGGRI